MIEKKDPNVNPWTGMPLTGLELFHGPKKPEPVKEYTPEEVDELFEYMVMTAPTMMTSDDK